MKNSHYYAHMKKLRSLMLVCLCLALGVYYL